MSLRQQSTSAFTLVELLMVVAIIGILAAVLIPSLLSARERAHDTATVSCLKQLGKAQEAARIDYPFRYDPALDPSAFYACDDITFAVQSISDDDFTYTAYHQRGRSLYSVGTGTAVVVTLVGGVP